MSTDPLTAATPTSPAATADARPDDAALGGGSPSAAPLPASDPPSAPPRCGTPTGGDAGTGAAPDRLRPRPGIEQILAAAAGGEGRVPSFADMVRHNATLTRDLGRAQRTIGVLTVERDALERRIEAARNEAATSDPSPDQNDDAGRGRWTLAVALLGLLVLLLMASWAFGWSAGDLPWSGREQPSQAPTPGG